MNQAMDSSTNKTLKASFSEIALANLPMQNGI